MRRNKQNKGFTLIELLVVIAIIGILASIIFASLTQAKEKSRDSERLQAMHQMVIALELYRSTYNRYPSTSGNSTYVKDIIGLAPKFIQSLPHDPTRTGTSQYRYVLDSSKENYTLLIDLEGDTVTLCRIDTGEPVMTLYAPYPICK